MNTVSISSPQEFVRFTAVARHDHDHDREYLNAVVQEFFERLSPKELRTWVPGYHIEVKFPARGTVVILRTAAGRKCPKSFPTASPSIPNQRFPTTRWTIRTFWSNHRRSEPDVADSDFFFFEPPAPALRKIKQGFSRPR